MEYEMNEIASEPSSTAQTCSTVPHGTAPAPAPATATATPAESESCSTDERASSVPDGDINIDSADAGNDSIDTNSVGTGSTDTGSTDIDVSDTNSDTDATSNSDDGASDTDGTNDTCVTIPSPPSSPSGTPTSSPSAQNNSNSPLKHMAKHMRAFFTPTNLVIVSLTVTALVWAVKSYNEAQFSNVLNRMETCRQHPKNAYIQNTTLCIEMRQREDYDISAPTDDESEPGFEPPEPQPRTDGLDDKPELAGFEPFKENPPLHQVMQGGVHEFPEENKWFDLSLWTVLIGNALYCIEGVYRIIASLFKGASLSGVFFTAFVLYVLGGWGFSGIGLLVLGGGHGVYLLISTVRSAGLVFFFGTADTEMPVLVKDGRRSPAHEATKVNE